MNIRSYVSVNINKGINKLFKLSMQYINRRLICDECLANCAKCYQRGNQRKQYEKEAFFNRGEQ